MEPPEDLPRDLTDRVFRKTLENVRNLQEFLRLALPDHAAAFDCAHAKLLPREFVAPDWRGREADLLFEIPYQTPDGPRPALVCVLIEHQSRTDVMMPFRTLFLNVAFWDRQWREWEQLPAPRPQFRFTPVVPIVLYTGPTPWGSTRRLSELLGEPSVFHAFAPNVEPLFWNLADHAPDELLSRDDGWPNLLAVVRNVAADAADFLRVCVAAVDCLNALPKEDRPRWQELVEAVVKWVYARRPQDEHATIQRNVEAVLNDPARKQEFHTMAEQTSEYLYERAYYRALAQGKELWFAEGELAGVRKSLRQQLTERFGPLSPELSQRINELSDLEKLTGCLSQVLRIQSLEELQL